MKIEKASDPAENRRLVRRYGDGYIVIHEQTIETSVILSASEPDTSWSPERPQELTAGDMELLLAPEPDLVLIGTGKMQHFPAPDTMAPFHRNGIGVEIMKTAAACRTFNILMNEGRKVVAGVLMI